MKPILVAFFAIGMAFLFSACSGGSSRKIAGNSCPKTYDPFPLEDTRYLSIDPSDTDALASGTFTYQSGALLFWDKDKNMKVHVNEKQISVGRDKKKEWQKNVACVQGWKPEYEGLSESAPLVTRIEVDAEGRPTIEFKEFGFSMEEFLKPQIPRETQKASQSPKKFFEDQYPDHTAKLFKIKEHGTNGKITYELRGEIVTDDNRVYRYQVELMYSPLAEESPYGNSCPKTYDPFPLEDTRYLSIDPSDTDALASGTFTYQSGALLFWDKDKNMKVHVNEKQISVGRDKKKEWQKNVACVQGWKPEYEGLSESAPLVTRIEVDAEGRPTIEFKEFGFSMEEFLKPQIPRETQKASQSPKKFFEDQYPDHTAKLFKIKEHGTNGKITYELRGEIVTDDDRVYRYQVELMYSPLVEAPAEEGAEESP